VLKYPLSMSSSHKYKSNDHYENDNDNNIEEFYNNKKVNVTDLVSKMKFEHKKEKKNNIILTAAAISAVTVFGIILTL